jgi:hypothetical protein
LVALTLTRYEGWCIAAALAIAAPAVHIRQGRRTRVWAFPVYLGAAVLAFLLLSYGSTGRWFTTSGFFVPDNPALHRPVLAGRQVVMATVALGGWVLVAAGLVGALRSLAALRAAPERVLPLSLFAAAFLPFSAFYQGHPLRVRYMVSLVAACAVLAGVLVGSLPRRLRVWAALGLAGAVFASTPPLAQQAPMVLEAQWEAPYRRERQAATDYLAQRFDGRPILASMGSLGHYMQETSSIGLRLSNFLHEGNGNLWQAALAAPSRHAGWVLVEQRAEGGDMLAERLRSNPSWLIGFVRVAEGGGVALFRNEQSTPR